MSVQLDRYLAARRSGLSRDDAAFEAGISLEEARLTDIAEQRGEIGLAPKVQQGGTTMARAAKQKTEEVEEIQKPDFDRAVRIYRQDIKPANEKSGEHAQTASTGYKAIKKECHVNTRAAKFVFQLAGESEEKRNDVLRSVRGLLAAMNIGITDDLVSQAEGEGEAPIVPTQERKPVELVTVN